MFVERAAIAVFLSTFLPSAIAIRPKRQPRQPTGDGDKLLTFNETVVESVFSVDYSDAFWLPGDEDGLVTYLSDAGFIILENYITGKREQLVSSENIPEDYWEYWIRPDCKQVLFSTNYTKQYRYSYFADYQLLDVQSGESTALVDDQAGDI